LAVGADRHEGRGVALSGTVSVVDAALDVGLPIGVTETNGRFVLEGSRVRIDRLAGRIGGGTFSVDGGLDVEGGPDVGWKVVDVSGSLLPSLEQELSGHGTLRGPWNDLTVAGEVEILRMLYDRNIEPRDFVPSFKRRLAPPSTSTSPNVVRLDLHVYAPDDLHIDNNFARVEAMADLQVRGTTEHPKLRGRIDVLNGEAFFRDRTFDIITGVVDFRPQLDLVADLNITAETVVDTPDTSYGITVQISGTTDAPRVVLSSDDPGLTQTDIVSLITFGKTVAQLQQGSGGSSADALVGFLTGRVAKGVEGGAESLLRVDRVEIEPAFSSTSGAFEPQVKISKDFSDDFSTSIATTLGVDLQRALNLEYHLTDRTSLLGTWESESEGQAGAFGGGIKFRREFRSVPGFSLLGTMRK
jgi:translocation and assembly module TamB